MQADGREIQIWHLQIDIGLVSEGREDAVSQRAGEHVFCHHTFDAALYADIHVIRRMGIVNFADGLLIILSGMRKRENAVRGFADVFPGGVGALYEGIAECGQLFL